MPTLNNIRIEDDAGNVFYPHTKASVVFMEDGKNAETVISQLSNPPININPDFKIWQRYNTGDVTTFKNPVNKYIADRYRANGTGTMTPVTNGAKITGTINIKYILEDADFQKLNGKTLTRSWSENGVIQKETFICNSATIFDKTIVNKTLNFIKLELGEIATPLSPKPYGEELALCQRYYEEINVRPVSYSPQVNTIFEFPISIIEKRVIPTLAVTKGNETNINTSYAFARTNKVIEVGMNSAGIGQTYLILLIKMDSEIY